MGGEDSGARQTFDYAASQCRSMDSRAHLASIHSVQENAFVLSYLVSQPKTDEIDVFWLGLIETMSKNDNE